MLIDRRIGLAMALCLGVFLTFELTPLDLALQDRLFDFDSSRWLLDRDNGLLRFLFYDGIKAVFVCAVVLLLAALLLLHRRPLIRRHRRALVTILASAVLVPLCIGALKGMTHTACPKDLERYGGAYPYLHVLEPWPAGAMPDDPPRCYPAGHASGGFSLLALIFLFPTPRLRRRAAGIALFLGFATGGYKMAIGDHTLGHTLMTLALAWLIILLIERTTRSWWKDPTP